ncbi:hypothetical protein WIS52_20830 [Pseudonocardia nematodicida]|uniref:Uncharacterized protein n=1 Tax=Pseudonocardia nematodicida TaxID=1206997 RepID=A0ABV1KEM1_9PSEU
MADGDDEGRRDDELAAAVDEAVADELKRRRARFLQEIMGADREEGVGRRDGEREDRFLRGLDDDPPG